MNLNSSPAICCGGEAGRLAYISEFIEEAKATGLVERAIERGGLRGVHVAPSGTFE
jgi:polar amino acid transport system substrate-binding protein